jgi:hypothetical protein
MANKDVAVCCLDKALKALQQLLYQLNQDG